MRYFKLVHYTSGEEYETSEFYINEPTFRKYQRAIAEDKDLLVLEDRVIKIKMIKEIMPAGAEIAEYRRMGIGFKELGLPECPQLEEGIKTEEEGFTKISGELKSPKL